MSDNAIPGAQAAPEFSFSRGYRRYVLGMLTLIYFINFVDRQILSILLQSIKEDLLLSDTQLGLLSGLAFAIFYTTLGIPIAWLADRFNRRNIIAICLTLWSVMTAICGLAIGFWTLFLARIGVGVGEAGASPPAHSIISDYFSARERTGALAMFACGAPLAALVGFALGGLLNEMIGWRYTFIAVGLPGVLVALIAVFTVKEPPRGHSDSIPDTVQPRMLQILSYMLTRRTFAILSIAIALQAFVSYSLMNWMPAFFERSHGLSSGEIGIKLGFSAVIGGMIGMLGGGLLADKLALRNLRWYCWLSAGAMLFGTPALAFMLMTDNYNFAFIAFSFAIGLVNVCVPISFTITQGVAPLRMRASAVALLFLIVNLIGIGVGPTSMGMASDYLSAAYGDDSLKMSLMGLIGLPVIAAFLLWMMASSVDRDFVTPHPGKKTS